MMFPRGWFFGERLRAKSGKARLREELELSVAGNFGPHIGKREPGNRARYPPDRFAFVDEFRVLFRNCVGFEIKYAQAAVYFASVVLTRDRFLARIAALREADVGLVEPGLRGQPQRIAGFPWAERLDVVRDNALQVVLGVGPGDADERTRSAHDGG